MNKSGKYLVWTVLSVMGAFALGYIALNRGEQINALWIVVASVCIYLIAYRFYGLYIAKNVLAVDPTRNRRGDSAGGLLYDHGHYPCRAGDDRG